MLPENVLLGSFWLPEPSSTNAPVVDALFYFILGISIFFFLLIVGVMTAFVLRYRRREGHEALPSPTHNNLLEAFWSVIPLLLVAVMFVWGFLGYMSMREAPADAFDIQVVAKKWSWSFIYPNGYVDSDLHAPLDRPVRLVMSSDDVIHSLYIPAFRLKMDVVPGRYAKTWFRATAPGTYPLFCAEYCGTQHSSMLANVVVHESGGYEKWLADAANFLKNLPPAEAGQLLYTRRGCAQCHSTDGSARVGPTFKGAFGAEHDMTSGEKLLVDENYIRQSILEPQAKIRKGFNPVMPTYQGQLGNPEIDAIIAFIKTLNQP